jgi:hypothetical protein
MQFLRSPQGYYRQKIPELQLAAGTDQFPHIFLHVRADIRLKVDLPPGYTGYNIRHAAPENITENLLSCTILSCQFLFSF